MVLEWAEKGNLKEVYKQYDITWNRKVHMVLDICRGIMFLNGANIFHHDIRCENVMVCVTALINLNNKNKYLKKHNMNNFISSSRFND
ncbi:hypothetical protein RhiirC2_755021, partial [Rhizophagus irregularis]